MTGSELKADIQRQMTDAMKAGDTVRVGALRMFISAIRYKEDELGHDLTDDEVASVAAKELKKRTESIEAFAGAGRGELAEKERAEREVIRAWAPSQMDEDAVDALIDEAFEATGATSDKDVGKVMGYVMAKAKGRADGTLVQQKVRARIEA